MRYLKKINENIEALDTKVSDELIYLKDSGFDFSLIPYGDKCCLRIWKPLKVEKEYSFQNCEKFYWSDIEDDLFRLFANENIHLIDIRGIVSRDSEFSVDRIPISVEKFLKRDVSDSTFKSVSFFF